MAPRHRDVIVVGASAGGVETLRTLVAGMPPDLDAAVAVVLHLPAGGTSALSQILRRVGTLPTVTAASGMPLRRGVIHTAPPDHHLLIIEDQLALSHGPTENGHRPAIDALFRSAAQSRGPRVIGVQLSGVLDDGVAGLVAVKAQGGLVVVQDPADALYPEMPENALRHVQADHVLPAADIGPLLAKLTAEREIGPALPTPPLLALENEIARDRRTAMDYQSDGMGVPSTFSCPDCQGVLTEISPDEGRFRCQVGHAWSAEALLEAQGDSIERAMWTAVRALDERATMADRMRRHAERGGNDRVVERYTRMADEAREAADLLRGRLTTIPLRAEHEAGP
ncbi:chemotaxis protein CheB [Kibdelosporangium persicum]|uniref:protein-glutamate methylesterase n=1 Tax=Kibdelosporangium persicum TaxID=2698649 RepID=A0ABX2EYK7_9PSEU|nr:chemotaxis protein CheB [Kibdelosporangium persicum]NRN64131.1 Two-component system chemotaxis response regulator CheB [Kibdelosporangium persicum]